jgi:transcription antitermination factor NusB
MQALYQLDIQGDVLLASIDQFFLENARDDMVREMASGWTKGAWSQLKECDELLARSVIKWQMSRISSVDKSILRLAAYQLKYCRDIPPKVTINEAIELAKRYSTAQAPGFINGVLDGLLRKLEDAAAAGEAKKEEPGYTQGDV